MTEPENRRPLASRDTGWARALAARLATTAITPNGISQAGIVAAALAALCFVIGTPASGGTRIALLIGAAVFIQLRLLCNLLDGMVAVEAGKATPDGGFWNEMPDRVADILILVGAGYGISDPGLGWAAAAFAVLTAYVRELGRGLGTDADFCGPMAKPHRMAVMTAAAVLSCFEPLWSADAIVLRAALWIVAVGAAITGVRRALRLLASLRH